jgi:hypothetical protein
LLDDTTTADYKRLREPFPKELIGKLPATAKRPAQDYVGHAAVTDRLNEAAPGWTYRVLDRFDAGGDCWVLVRMEIDGVGRDEYGDGRDPKVAIGNALRRGAMRWGVALDLWSKEELQSVVPGTEVHSSTETESAAAAAVVPGSTSTSEGGSGVGVASDSANGEGARPDLSSDDSLDAVVRAYGSSAKAMLAARRIWPDTTSIAQLDAEQRAALIGEAP